MRDGRILYPMYHPGYVIRGALSERSYQRQFRRLAHLLTRLKDAKMRSDTPG